MERKQWIKKTGWVWRASATVLVLALLAVTAIEAGCEASDAVANFFKTDKDRFLNAGKVVHQPDRTPIVPILSSMSPADSEEDMLPNSEFPQPSDYIYSDEDYRIGPTDVLDVAILDLFQPGMETTIRRQVETSGFIDLPLLDQRVLADGFTALELKREIINAYRPLLRNPNVSVTVVTRRQSTFSIIGSVLNPGTYEISRRDMRLMDAISLARGVTTPTIRYIYIIRPEPAIKASEVTETTVVAPVIRGPDEDIPLPGDDVPLPGELPPLPGDDFTPPAQPDDEDQLDAAALLAHVRGMKIDSASLEEAGLWDRERGQWEAVTFAELATEEPADAMPGALEETPADVGDDNTYTESDPFEWDRANRSDMARVIAINLSQLYAGDPRMNIIIQDNDIVHVPAVEVGEFYIMGEVNRPGVYSLTGRRITVKMAVAAAGNFGVEAWPENSILIRRIAENQEQIIPIDIEKIFTGEESDLYLKPNDVIAVGTNAAASFMAVIRNAFRMTYGFGFIYDRNFADPLTGPVNSRRFTHW
jgi:polysaccharide export outer membrane protein